MSEAQYVLKYTKGFISDKFIQGYIAMKLHGNTKHVYRERSILEESVFSLLFKMHQLIEKCANTNGNTVCILGSK